MYPPSPFAVPIGSFQQPVVPPSTDPNEGPLFYIPVNCDWMPYVAGALQQLLLQTTWDCDAERLGIVQAQVFTLIAKFNCAVAATKDELCGSTEGIGGCEDMCGCLRYQDGKLQMMSCGSWADVPGQTDQGAETTPQPGVGSPQPQPGGGCAGYFATIVAGQRWLVPTLMSDGDTYTPSRLDGVTTDVFPGRWNCPDGGQYVLGQNVGNKIFDSSAPVPSLPLGSLVLNVGGAYFDATVPVTITGGNTNAIAQLLLNYPSGGNYSGSVTAFVEICNNQSGPWASFFNFLLQSYSDLFTVDAGAWVEGTGWVGTDFSSIQHSFVALEALATGVQINTMRQEYDCAGAAGGSQIVAFTQTGGYYGTPQNPTVGSSEVYGQVTNSTADNPGLQLCSGTDLGPVTVLSLTVTGTGPKPAGWP